MSLFEYTTWGRRTGGCGHRHRSYGLAVSCRRNAQRSFRRMGVVVDRDIVEISGDVPIEPVDVPVRLYLDRYVGNPWGVVVAAIVLDALITSRYVVDDLFDVFPYPSRLADAHLSDVEAIVRSKVDATSIVRFSGWWDARPDDRYVPDVETLADAPGVSRFAVEAYAVLVLRTPFETRDLALAFASRRSTGHYP